MEQPTVSSAQVLSPDPVRRRAWYDDVRAREGRPALTDSEWAALRGEAKQAAAKILAGPPPGAWDELKARLGR
jgi:hypothetical protein